MEVGEDGLFNGSKNDFDFYQYYSRNRRISEVIQNGESKDEEKREEKGEEKGDGSKVMVNYWYCFKNNGFKMLVLNIVK